MTEEVADEVINGALGEEIRRARDDQGMTRAGLAARMPVEISAQALGHYEYGTRPCTLPRLVHICSALNVSAPALFGLALQRAGIGLYTNDIQVSLNAIVKSNEKGLGPLRTWARNRLAIEQHGTGIAIIDQALAEQWAILTGFSKPEFIETLVTFAPAVAPPW